MTKRRRPSGLSSALLLVVAFTACGGGDDGNTDTTAVIAAREATEADAPPVEATQASEEGSGPSPSGENVATVTIGSETYTFAMVDEGTCDPDFFGNFRAFLTHVDENGEPIEMQDEPGFTEGITISLSLTEDVVGAMGGEFGGTVWTAGEADNVDTGDASYSVDGARAEGTMTFVNSDGEAQEGSFVVVCAEG